MIRYIDGKINSITMYRLTLYGLVAIAVYAILLGFFSLIPYSAQSIALSLVSSLLASYVSNYFLAKFFRVPSNIESWAITGFIVFCLFSPIIVFSDIYTIFAAVFIAMGSKYLLVYGRRHIFNPAALAAVVLSIFPSTVALWWVGSPLIFPAVFIVGFLIVYKVRRFRLFLFFIGAMLVGLMIFGFVNNTLGVEMFKNAFLSGPYIFLCTIMLTEPQTLPPSKKTQMIYAVLVGLLSVSQFNFLKLYSSPELALVLGNVFSFFVSYKRKIFLKFEYRKKIAENIFEFAFKADRFEHKPGQYLEWTLKHFKPDGRGIRRFFTIASSPTEELVKIGVRIDNSTGRSSSFKNNLLKLKKGDRVLASILAGDFVLPKDKTKNIVFIAGGIGVTPFRSMIRYIIDKGESRNITLLYFNKVIQDIAYKDLFDEANKMDGVNVYYVLTDIEKIPQGWNGLKGRLDPDILRGVVNSVEDSIFYISGPSALVDNYSKLLRQMGVKSENIVRDYFPGF